MSAQEAADMCQFQDGCLIVYKRLKELGLDMELQGIVEPAGSLDLERFHLLTKPNRAATGLNCVRLMKKFLEWGAERKDLLEWDGAYDAKLEVLDYVEYLIQQQAGYLTPRSFLYAPDFFSTALGVSFAGGHWGRAKRLSQGYLSLKTEPVSRAASFVKATMSALESMLLDPFAPRPERS